MTLTIRGQTVSNPKELVDLLERSPELAPEIVALLPEPLRERLHADGLDPAKTRQVLVAEARTIIDFSAQAATAAGADARRDRLGFTAERPGNPALDAALELDLTVPISVLRRQLDEALPAPKGSQAWSNRRWTVHDHLAAQAIEGKSWLSAAIDARDIRRAVDQTLSEVQATLRAAAGRDPAALEEVQRGLDKGLFYFIHNGALRIDQNALLSRAMSELYGLSVATDGHVGGTLSPLWWAIERLPSRDLTDNQRGYIAGQLFHRFSGKRAAPVEPQDVNQYVEQLISLTRT
jgi:hypothetical protein